jgi:hypothetical protein
MLPKSLASAIQTLSICNPTCEAQVLMHPLYRLMHRKLNSKAVLLHIDET